MLSALLRHRPVLTGAVLLFVLLAAAYVGSIDIRASRGAAITGDEPFYLFTTQSLLQDGDLDLSQQYARRSYRSFFDHPWGLWTQSVPNADGRLLSPHNVGLSVFVLPGFHFAGLLGAQVQMLLTAALTFALTFVLVSRVTGRQLLSWLVTAAVGLSATAFIYSTEVYPEVPAALALVVAVLLVLSGRGHGAARGVALAVVLSALPWLGVKYAPLAVVVAAFFMIRASRNGRLALSFAAALSAVAFAWFHLETYGSLTPYSVNIVYAGEDVPELLNSHVALDRFYRIWGLFVDQRFGIGRWSPLLLVAVPGMVVAWRSGGAGRLVVLLFATQLLIATFVAITMMGWWFPGRTLMTVLPLLALPVTLLALRLSNRWRLVLGGLALYSVAVTGALAYAGHTGQVAIAVDPFRMSAWFFQWPAPLFPDYTGWTLRTWLTTAAWIAVGAAAMLAVAIPDLRVSVLSRLKPGNSEPDPGPEYNPQPPPRRTYRSTEPGSLP